MTRWCLAGIAVSAAIGWFAAMCHSRGWAPLGLISMGVGVTLGVALAGIAATQRVAGSWQLVVGTLLLAIVAVLAEHAWLYRDFRRQWREAREASAQAALFRPESPWSPAEYFTREWSPRRAALWCLDAVIIASSAVGTVLVLQRNSTEHAEQERAEQAPPLNRIP
jgi:hypothetical protein